MQKITLHRALWTRGPILSQLPLGMAQKKIVNPSKNRCRCQKRNQTPRKESEKQIPYFWILLMEEILHQLIGSFSHFLYGFIHLRWCRIAEPSTVFLELPIWYSYMIPITLSSPCTTLRGKAGWCKACSSCGNVSHEKKTGSLTFHVG